ncbi:MAG: ABC transporter substrate-binding protein [Coriobacteriia bacterium]|nr:ABC transporter substrate-binding protein [Coriobacteriia bacterium]
MGKTFGTKHFIFFAVAMLVIGTIAFTFVGCNQNNDDKGFNTIKEGTLKVGVEVNNYPVSYKNTNDKIVGVEINYLETLCKEAGFEIEYVPMGFDRLIEAIKNHEVDISMNQISVTEARRQIVDFCEPYSKNGASLYFREDSTYTLDSLQEKADTSEVKLATQDGTYFPNFKSRFKGNFVNVPYTTVDDAIAAVQKGEVDCLIYDSNPIARTDMTKNQHLKEIFLDIMPVYNIAIALNKDLNGVKDKLNPIIKTMNNDEYLERVKEYFYTLDNPRS